MTWDENVEAIAGAIDTKDAEIRKLREAIAPFARLKIPTRPQGNAGAYSLLFDDIQRAKDAIAS